MEEKGKKSSMETFASNDKVDYYFGITSITVNGKNAYELKGKFLDDLHNNAFSGTNKKDSVKHIEYYLKIINPIKLPNVDHDKLRIVVFPISLAGEFSSDKEEETAKIFKIESDVFDYATPLCMAFNEFNYLLKVDSDLLTKDIMGFKTYEDYKGDWIYEWNENVPWVYDKPWLDNGIWKEPQPAKHDCKPFNYKTGCSEWPTCSWREDGYCNGGNFPGAYHIGNSLHYQDLEWMVIVMEEFFLELTILETRSITKTLNEMIKYSFEQDEEYVAVKEDEYDDLARTSNDACRSYQEIFLRNGRMMDGASVSVMPVSTYLNLGLSELAHTKLTVELADRTVKYPNRIDENVLVGDENIIFNSVKPASNLIKRVYMLSLRERMELDLEARIMGETLVLNRSLDPLDGDYIELNDLNEPLELRRNQVDDLMPAIKEGEVIDAPIDDLVNSRNDKLDTGIDDYPIDCEYDKKIRIDFLKDMEAYRDEEMGDVIVGEPFLREIGIKARRYEGMITIYKCNEEVTYQMVQSHQSFKHYTNVQCNNIPPLLKDEVMPKSKNDMPLRDKNKSDLDTMSINDLYNNFKIVEQEVKETTSTNSSSQSMGFVSSPSPNSTNEVPTAYGLSTASTQSSTASTQVSTTNLSDATVYAFLSIQSNGSQVV
nr:hypothetical protein [Tanacetum cinerariifolium]